MNIKEIIRWCWTNRLWFVISVVLCVIVGAFYFVSSTPKRKVSAAIMLRTTDRDSQQGQMMNIMGETANKQALDEIRTLTSRDLMRQVVDSLHLNYIVEERHHLKWIPVYPMPEFAFQYEPASKKKVYKQVVDGTKYRITVFPQEVMIDLMLRQLKVERLSRESQVITLSIITKNPHQSEAMIDLLLSLYNEASLKDKSSVAMQTQAFLDERLSVVRAELNDAESTMEIYKSTHQITNIDQTASEYQRQIENYQQQLADVNLTLRVLDDLDTQLQTPYINNAPRALYADFKSGNLNTMINEYNRNVDKRIQLLESTTESNPLVQTLDQSLMVQRTHITIGAKEARTSAQTRKEHLTEQIKEYASRLAQLPEQERTYLEMKRNTQTKEEQYLYLIEKSEENNLVLASSAISAKVLERAQMSADVVSPNLIRTGLASVIIGLLLPLLVLLLLCFRKEIL